MPPAKRVGSEAAMMPKVLGELTPARFLAEYWQKQPLLVRGAWPGFQDPLTPEELAGLACEEGVESRLVLERGWGLEELRPVSLSLEDIFLQLTTEEKGVAA